MTVLALAVLGLIAGCATRGGKPKDYIFFPTPPNEPRIQYLTSFGSDHDLGGGGSAFSDFVLGREKAISPIYKPYGVTATPGKIYVCDTMLAGVDIIDLTKRRFDLLRPGSGMGVIKMPVGVAVAADGTRYVTDTGRGQVLIYDQTGAFLGAIGQPGTLKPAGIVATGDRLYVGDLKKETHAVRVYNRSTKELLFTVPRDPNDEKARLFQPTNLAVDSQGRILVSDTASFCVQIYDAEGQHLRTVGSAGDAPGSFFRNKGIAADRAGRFYVVDSNLTVVQMFDAEGRLLMYFGEPKNSGPAGLYLPAGVCVDYENVKYFEPYVAPGQKLEYLIYVTNQVGKNSVSVFGFLRKP